MLQMTSHPLGHVFEQWWRSRKTKFQMRDSW